MSHHYSNIPQLFSWFRTPKCCEDSTFYLGSTSDERAVFFEGAFRRLYLMATYPSWQWGVFKHSLEQLRYSQLSLLYTVSLSLTFLSIRWSFWCEPFYLIMFFD